MIRRRFHGMHLSRHPRWPHNSNQSSPTATPYFSYYSLVLGFSLGICCICVSAYPAITSTRILNCYQNVVLGLGSPSYSLACKKESNSATPVSSDNSEWVIARYQPRIGPGISGLSCSNMQDPLLQTWLVNPGPPRLRSPVDLPRRGLQGALWKRI
jgi:hypothetical protein